VPTIKYLRCCASLSKYHWPSSNGTCVQTRTLPRLAGNSHESGVAQLWNGNAENRIFVLSTDLDSALIIIQQQWCACCLSALSVRRMLFACRLRMCGMVECVVACTAAVIVGCLGRPTGKVRAATPEAAITCTAVGAPSTCTHVTPRHPSAHRSTCAHRGWARRGMSSGWRRAIWRASSSPRPWRRNGGRWSAAAASGPHGPHADAGRESA
jgi:hypothetical protein